MILKHVIWSNLIQIPLPGHFSFVGRRLDHFLMCHHHLFQSLVLLFMLLWTSVCISPTALRISLIESGLLSRLQIPLAVRYFSCLTESSWSLFLIGVAQGFGCVSATWIAQLLWCHFVPWCDRPKVDSFPLRRSVYMVNHWERQRLYRIASCIVSRPAIFR